MRSQGFLFGTLLWRNTLLKRGCRSNEVSRLFADKTIIVVTTYCWILIRKWVGFSKFFMVGMKKCGAHSYSVSYIQRTCFWRAQNIVDRNFCVAIILWWNPLERFPVQVPQSTHLFSGIQPHHKVPGDLWVKIYQNAVIKIRLWGFSLENGPELAIGQSNSRKKNGTQFLKNAFCRTSNVLRYTKHRASKFLNLSALFSGSIPMDPSPTNRNFQIAISGGTKTWRGDLFINCWESYGE